MGYFNECLPHEDIVPGNPYLLGQREGETRPYGVPSRLPRADPRRRELSQAPPVEQEE